MKRAVYCLSAVLIVAGCSKPAQPLDRCLQMSAQVGRVGDEHRFVARLMNASDAGVELNERFVPWGPNALNWGERPALEIEVRDHANNHLEPVRPISDISPDRMITLAPGATLTGYQTLDSYFPELGAALERGPVTVQWRYHYDGPGSCESYGGAETLRP